MRRSWVTSTPVVAWAKGQGADTAPHWAVTGFCWGGRITWLYSAHNPACEGRRGLVRPPGGLRQSALTTGKHPVDLAGALNGPVLGLYGGQDSGIPLDSGGTR